MDDKITVTQVLPKQFLIRQSPNSRYFILGKDSILLGVDTFILLLGFLVKNNFISSKVLEGLLEEISEE